MALLGIGGALLGCRPPRHTIGSEWYGYGGVGGTMKKIADGIEYRVPPTIDDPVILDEITAALTSLGYPHT
jgi:hypothetical protein